MIEQFIAWVCNMVDHTYDNGSDVDEKLKMILREKAKIKKKKKLISN